MAAVGGGACPGGGAALEEECEVVRVRVKKSEGLQPPEFRSFAVDPQITSLDVLQHILARAFDLQGKKSFSISFAARDPQGQESFVPLLSDGDLAAAFACARPALRLRLDVRPPAESPLLEDWDIISPREVAAVEPLPERRSLLAAALPFTQALLAQVGRTLARAQAALAWPEGSPPLTPAAAPPLVPLSDADLRTYLGPGGRLLRPHDLRLHVYHGGVEPGLRKVVWRYLLNVFPAGLSGQERLAHLRHKAGEYAALKAALAARAAPAELALVAAAVRKDVVRTDRGHPYFGGPEEGHPHLAALQALLTTFALGHPRLSYCQGMSDVAAPLLAVLDDEAQAFLCFCSLMRRLGPRFRPGGRGLARAFAHLRRLLRRADPPFWAFLAARGAHDLLFCYRWLLLELKREFAFEDALRVLEITWSSLPPAPPPPPDGVPLLGAPLGLRRARRGLRERRGLRPRPPRRLRRQRQRMEATADGQEGAGSSNDGSKVSVGVPEAPKRFGDEQETPKSSSDVLEGPGNSTVIQSFGDDQEGLKSFSSVKDGFGGKREKLEVYGDVSACPDNWNDQEGLKTSWNVPGSTKGLGEVQGGANAPRGLQEHPKASSDGGQDAGAPKDTGEAQDPDVSRKTCEAHSISKKPREDGNTLEKSDRNHSASKASGGHLDAPKDISRDSKLLPVVGDSFQEISGDSSCSLGEVGEDAKDAGGDPRRVGKDPEEGEDCKEADKDRTEVGKDPNEVGEGPKQVDGDPEEVGVDPIEVREDPIAFHEDPLEFHEDPIEFHEDSSMGMAAAEDPWGGTWAWEASSSSSSSCSSSSSEDEVGVEDDGAPLPPPEELGQGNPFLLFLCLAMLLEQREAVMGRAGDYNEVAMHFDRLVRRHHLPRVLHRAKGLFARYLEGWGGAPPGGHSTG
ncbi:LOW QUALITY PROTEIN: TBC1 domain family member 25 [Strigops habroptila]|uniref:LOW QUALITY PROTEIN: TBC1 domain family member 25 n=1 Tax=Strigops habroptila TaxID=2489341 RepID=UPI0011CEDA84|nr:LOW QUALITY PROTEIN: TBC1 domain family member 25 [Strigops habroptila]